MIYKGPWGRRVSWAATRRPRARFVSPTDERTNDDRPVSAQFFLSCRRLVVVVSRP